MASFDLAIEWVQPYLRHFFDVTALGRHQRRAKYAQINPISVDMVVSLSLYQTHRLYNQNHFAKH